jgi:sec-independent protein translocase protein TatA
MFRLGPLELTIILAIVILLFGIGRIGKIGGELGAGIKAFREGLGNKEDEDNEEADASKEKKS